MRWASGLLESITTTGSRMELGSGRYLWVCVRSYFVLIERVRTTLSLLRPCFVFAYSLPPTLRVILCVCLCKAASIDSRDVNRNHAIPVPTTVSAVSVLDIGEIFGSGEEFGWPTLACGSQIFRVCKGDDELGIGATVRGASVEFRVAGVRRRGQCVEGQSQALGIKAWP